MSDDASTDPDLAIVDAVHALRPGAAFAFDHGKGPSGITFLEPGKSVTVEELNAEISRRVTTKASQTLDAHLEDAISELSPAPDEETATQGKTDMATTPGSHALTIKQVLEEHSKKLDQVLQAQLALLQTELGGQLDTVVTGTEAVIRQVRGHTDDFKAILGQFTNGI